MIKPKILCVDDESGVLDALARVLQPQFKVFTATDANTAYKMIEQHPDITVIISDYRMPGINGIDFLRSVRTQLPQAARAILSGQMDIRAVSEAINRAEIHRFLLKPWENDYLVLQCLELLQMHASLVENSRLHLLSITDPVTQLTNHRYFQDRLRKEIERAESSGQPLSLLMIDIDHFKSFNDRFGHPVGDRLLFEIAQQMESQVGPRAVTSRYGGEEFAVLLPGVDTFQALQKADKIRRAIEATPLRAVSGTPTFVTVSMGVASYPHLAKSATELIESADQALYQAKKMGRNKAIAANQ